MCKLGNSGDTKGTSYNGGEASVEPGKWSKGKGRGRMKFINGITTIDHVYI